MRFHTTHHRAVVGLLTTVAAFTLAVTSTFGITLDLIPTISGDTANSGRAITPDGQYVVGLSAIGAASTGHGFLYDVSTGTAVWVLGVGGNSVLATGVGYRTDPSSQTQILIDGKDSGGWHAVYMTTDGGATWAARRNDSIANASSVILGTANTLGSSISSDVFFTTYRDNNNSLYNRKSSGTWGSLTTTTDVKSTAGTPSGMSGVSASGRAVGFRSTATSGGSNQNYIYDSSGGNGSGALSFVNGLAGSTLGTAWAVSANGGVVVGYSPTASDPTHLYGYLATLNASRAELSIAQLPLLAGTGGSTTMSVAYGTSSDARYTVGMDYPGVEKAVLWDTSDANSANWTVLDLTQYATDRGILNGWQRLSRAYSVGVDPTTGDAIITGQGVWADGTTRAFVLEVPEPTTLSLLGLGVLGMAALRRKK